MSQEQRQKIVDMRQRILNQEPYSDEELADAIATLRILRSEAAAGSRAKRAAKEPKVVKPGLDLNTLVKGIKK